MKKGRIRRASFMALGLGALGGCNDTGEAPPFKPNELFASAPKVEVDSAGSVDWRNYRTAKGIHRAWAPPTASPWRAYYKPTLPAAMNIVTDAAAPVHAPSSLAEKQAEDFLSRVKPGSAVILDLPGEESVGWAVKLAARGMEPVLTFNNWPHPQGVVPLELPLGALLYYAQEMAAIRRDRTTLGTPDPVFLLDSRRLGLGVKGTPSSKFDNRYFHVGADLPAPDVLKKAGIAEVWYVGLKKTTPSGCQDDLADWFAALPGAGLRCTLVSADAAEPVYESWTPKVRSTVFSAPVTEHYTSTQPHRYYGRSYYHYHSFWSRNTSTWGSGSSGGGSRSFS